MNDTFRPRTARSCLGLWTRRFVPSNHASPETVAVGGSKRSSDIVATLTFDAARTFELTIAAHGDSAFGSGRWTRHHVHRDGADGCREADDEWQMWSAKAAWRGTSAGYRTCPGRCPTARAIEMSDPLSGTRVEIHLDGSGHATWTSSSGQHGQYPVACR